MVLGYCWLISFFVFVLRQLAAAEGFFFGYGVEGQLIVTTLVTVQFGFLRRRRIDCQNYQNFLSLHKRLSVRPFLCAQDST
jgi:hypothetical protein